jgi:rhodanese-related sulfurtransferase
MRPSVRAVLVARRTAGALLLAIVLTAHPALGGHGNPSEPVKTIAAADLKTLLDRGPRPLLVDLRPAEAYRQGHLPGARSLPIRELRRRYAELPRGPVVLYCDCPREELDAAYRFLVDRGVEDVRGLDEPFAAWVARGYPVAR